MLKRILQASRRGGSDDFADALGRADRARDAGDPARAAILYGHVLERWGPNFGLYVQRGNALKDSGAFAEAEQAYSAALRIEPGDADCHLQLGHLMKLTGNRGAALACYRDAHRLDPGLPDPPREICRIEEEAIEARHADRPQPGGAARPPQRMLVDTIDRGDRARLMRERFADAMRWRRD